MPDKDPSLMARCPECDSRIYFDRRPDNGQMIVCPECEACLEVIRNNPIRLDWASEEGERAGPLPAPLDDFFGLGSRDEARDQDSSYGEDEDYSRY